MGDTQNYSRETSSRQGRPTPVTAGGLPPCNNFLAEVSPRMIRASLLQNLQNGQQPDDSELWNSRFPADLPRKLKTGNRRFQMGLA